MTRIVFLQTRMGMGGAEMMWVQLIEKMDRTKFEPIICCLYEAGILGERLRKKGFQVYDGLAAHRYDLRVFFRLFKLLRFTKAQVLYVINQPVPQFWGALCGKMAHIPVMVSSIHSTGKISRAGRRQWINHVTLGWMDKVTALSESHKKYLMEVERIPEAKIEIISNGIEVAHFTNLTSENKESSSGIPGKRPRVGILGMLRPEKAHDVFLRTAKIILKEMPDVHFLIIGDGPLRQKLEAYSSELGIASHVHFLGLRQDVPDILQGLDVAVLSSHPIVETLSVAVLEYMAAGKPVVATRVGSIPELVQDGENGYLVSPGDSDALADRIMRLLKNPVLAGQMGKVGQVRVAAQYTAESMVERAQSFFSGLLQEKAGV